MYILMNKPYNYHRNRYENGQYTDYDIQNIYFSKHEYWLW